MKCIYCQNDAKYKDRSDGKCPGCHRKFAFEPKQGHPFTDGAFVGAILRVSANNAVRFSRANLYYELARVFAKRRPFAVGLVVGALGVLLCFVLHTPVPLLLTVGAVFVTFSKKAPLVRLSSSQFDGALRLWTSAHGVPPKLIAPKPEPRPNAAARVMQKDLAAYSFDRAVICDRRETVDLLLANNFHFENNCAVLSVNGYPEAVFEPVREMLRRNPKLEVFALHDASAAGQGLARHLASSSDWFRGIGRVTDVGLLYRHTKALRGLWTPATSSGVPDLARLSSAERGWYQRYQVELAAVRPEQIIKRLFRAISSPGTQVEGDDGAAYYITDSLGSDAGASDGGDDSFG